MDTDNEKIVLVERPEGELTVNHFEVVDAKTPSPSNNEFSYRILYMSIDPSMRLRMKEDLSGRLSEYVDSWESHNPKGRLIGEVIESRDADISEGDRFVGVLDWKKYGVAKASDIRLIKEQDVPLSTHLGMLGMTGITAYFGMLDIANPRPGDTAIVSGAAGATGSVAGQIARLNGCRVVGIAGSDAKIEYLTDHLGYDAGINYKTTSDMERAIAETCPEGVDVYFDNVGGEISDAVISHINTNARISICGQISQYDTEEEPVGPRKMMTLVEKQAKMEGFLCPQFSPRFEEARESLSTWIRNEDLRYEENIIEGFENAPRALVGLFDGENIGKQLVKVHTEAT